VFWIARSVIRSAGRPSSRKTEPRPRPERTQADWLIVTVIFITGAVVVILGVARLGPLALGVLIPAALGLFILGGVFLSSAMASGRAQRKIRDLPTIAAAADEARKTLEMRAQAAGWQFRGDTAVRALPKPPQARPRPAQQRPRVITRRQIMLDAEDDARLLRIAAILVQPCPFCGAEEGGLCLPVEGCKWYALDRARGIYAHPMRIAKAIGSKSAELEDVLAQFDGNLPEDITVSLI
jgi:hypothetical protein